jgi:hypothetical protein
LTAIVQSIGAVGSDGAALSAQARPFGTAFSEAAARLLQPLFITSLIVLLIAAAAEHAAAVDRALMQAGVAAANIGAVVPRGPHLIELA